MDSRDVPNLSTWQIRCLAYWGPWSETWLGKGAPNETRGRSCAARGFGSEVFTLPKPLGLVLLASTLALLITLLV